MSSPFNHKLTDSETLRVGLSKMDSRQQRGDVDGIVGLNFSEEVESTSNDCSNCSTHKSHVPVDEPVHLFDSLSARPNLSAPCTKESALCKSNTSQQLFPKTLMKNNAELLDEKPKDASKRHPDVLNSRTDQNANDTRISPNDEARAGSTIEKKKKKKKKKQGGAKEEEARPCELLGTCVEPFFLHHNFARTPLSREPTCADSCCYGATYNDLRSKTGRSRSGKNHKKHEHVIKACQIEGNRGTDDVDILVGFVEGNKKSDKSKERKTKKQKETKPEPELPSAPLPAPQPVVPTPPAAAKKTSSERASPSVPEPTPELEFTNFEGLEAVEEAPFETYVGRKKKTRASRPCPASNGRGWRHPDS